MDWIARKKDWRQFFRFEERINRFVGSAYHSALLLDPDLAAAGDKAPRQTHPPLWRFSNQMHLLTDIGDILYKQAVKDPATAALPRPLTAADHLRLSKRQAGMDRTIKLFSPVHAGLTPRLSA
ncbi:hypothetical protein [Nocardia sp. NPDC057030]|uniref:hypothetical protein n=1 Tax=unclassified Nocardia TaxID=2637762 RepID=UPI00363CE867